MYNIKVLDSSDIEPFIESKIQPRFPGKHIALIAHPIVKLTGESKIACMVQDLDYLDHPVDINTLQVQESETQVLVDIEHLVQFMIDSGTIPEDDYFVYYKW